MDSQDDAMGVSPLGKKGAGYQCQAGDGGTVTLLPARVPCRALHDPGQLVFEWRHTPLGKKTKDKMAIGLQKSKLVYMAGVYKKLEDGREVFTVLTRSADAQMRPIHDRMPVMLTEEGDRKAYLSGPAEAFVLLANLGDPALNISLSPK
jgi:hypothetical protein